MNIYEIISHLEFTDVEILTQMAKIQEINEISGALSESLSFK